MMNIGLKVSSEHWQIESLETILREWGFKYEKDKKRPTFIDFYVDVKAGKVIYRMFFDVER